MIRINATSAFVLAMLLSSVSFSQIAEKTLVKSFNLQGNQTVVLDLTGQVEVQTWASSTLRVQMQIGVENHPVSFLKGLISTGRYNLKASETAEGLSISTPGLDRKVLLKGEELIENISFLVFVPESVQVLLPDSSSAFAEIDEDNSRL